MKKIAILSFSILISLGCGTATQQSVNISQQSSNNSLTVSSHSNQNSATPNLTVVANSETKTKWKQSGDPIDTSEFDKEVVKAEKDLKAKPKDETAKKALSLAYVKRGVALTGARQYASALGDYRRTLKLDPSNAEAKNGLDQIISIYESLNREYPKEGEEPPPLPLKKG